MTTILSTERAVIERLLPGLDDSLAHHDDGALERADGPGLDLLRTARGPALMVPEEYGGVGASLLDAVRVQRAVGARSPSLGIAANMHHCTVIAMPPCPASQELLSAVASHGLFLASAFGEGVPEASILAPRLRAERTTGGWVLHGSKKPCSLSRSMDFLTASVTLPARSGSGTEVGLAIVPADAPGLTVKDSLPAPVLLGSETMEVVLDGVLADDDAISYLGHGDELNNAIATAFFTFELLVTATYLGAVTGLVEEVVERGRGNAAQRLEMVSSLEAVMASLEAVTVLDAESIGTPTAVARSLYVRYAGQDVISRVANQAAELLGGMSYLGRTRTIDVLTASRALAFHPPSRTSMAEGLDRYIAGGGLVMP